jgi:hypothetical protein
MPNHCFNVLNLIDAPEETSKALKKYVSKDPKSGDEFLDFNKIIKMPKALLIDAGPTDDKTKKLEEENLKRYGFKNWYDWCVANWGTKWNSYDFQVQDSCVTFSTAWSPPEPVIAKLAEKTGKDWRLRYTEEGMSFCGELHAYNTDSVHHNSWNIDDAPTEFREDMSITDEDIYSEEELEERRLTNMKEKLKKGVKQPSNNSLDDLL